METFIGSLFNKAGLILPHFKYFSRLNTKSGPYIFRYFEPLFYIRNYSAVSFLSPAFSVASGASFPSSLAFEQQPQHPPHLLSSPI